MKATKNLSAALYAAYLIAESAALATVFRIDCANGDQYFFATSTEPELVGHQDAQQRMPRRLEIRTLVAVASVAAKAEVAV